MPTLGKVLNAAREAAGQSQVELAERLGRHRTVISARENDRKDLPASELLRIAAATGRSILATPGGWEVVERADQFHSNGDREDHYRSERPGEGLPVFGDVSAGTGVFAEDEAREWFDIQRRWVAQIDGVLRVTGDSMEPMLRRGDWIGVRLEEYYRDGDIVILEMGPQAEVLIKVYAGVTAEGQRVFASLNPQYPPMVLHDRDHEVRGIAYGFWRDGRLRI